MDIRQFETKHQIRLPADFAAFLQLAGNGGAGPYYGIYGIEKMHPLDYTVDDPPANFLALPCPLYPDMSRENDWEKEFNNDVYHGILVIGTQGCSYMIGLIVTGEYAGRVVYLDEDNQPPYVILEPDFLSWYERWLDELLAGCEMSGFGYGLRGEEPQLWQIFDDPATQDRHRGFAVDALLRWPTLSRAGRGRAAELLGHPLAGVRAAACRVVRKFQIHEAAKLLVPRLQDEAAEVRQAAVYAAENLQQRFDPEAVVLLFDENEEVAQSAYFALNATQPHSRAILLQLLRSPHRSLRGFAANAIDWKLNDVPLLIELLADENFSVRHYAILGLRQLKNPSCLPAATELLAREIDPNHIDNLLRLLGDIPGETNVDLLLKWIADADDLHRLAAFESLCKLGDLRAKPVAEKLLAETKTPSRRTNLGWMGDAKSIATLARESLRKSPHEELRKLGGGWWNWLKPW